MADRIDPRGIDDGLTAAIAALREVSAAPPAQVASTRGRVMTSLEHRGRGRRKRVVIAALMASLGTGTLSWAAATGRIERALVAIGLRAEPPPATPVVVPTPVAIATTVSHHHSSDRTPPLAASAAPVLVPIPDAPAPPVIPVEPVLAPARAAPRHVVHRRVDDVVELRLYREAHDAHFRGTDARAALDGWDAYLAERPAGRFAIEARYNRALALIRLHRPDDARAALAPFAEGTVDPPGYRQTDARELIDALDRAEPE